MAACGLEGRIRLCGDLSAPIRSRVHGTVRDHMRSISLCIGSVARKDAGSILFWLFVARIMNCPALCLANQSTCVLSELNTHREYILLLPTAATHGHVLRISSAVMIALPVRRKSGGLHYFVGIDRCPAVLSTTTVIDSNPDCSRTLDRSSCTVGLRHALNGGSGYLTGVSVLGESPWALFELGARIRNALARRSASEAQAGRQRS